MSTISYHGGDPWSCFPQDTLDSLNSQLSVIGQGWEDQGTSIHQQYKELLAHFTLNTLDV